MTEQATNNEDKIKKKCETALLLAHSLRKFLVGIAINAQWSLGMMN